MRPESPHRTRLLGLACLLLATLLVVPLVLAQPQVEVEVVVLLAPQHPRQRLAQRAEPPAAGNSQGAA